MESILDVASYIIKSYERRSHQSIDEMKLHKLLYFSQREHIAITGKPLFSESFESWRFGPVSPLVRENFTKLQPIGNQENIQDDTDLITSEAAYVVNNVLEQYAGYESWKLSELSHQEISWQNAQKRSGASEQLEDSVNFREYVSPAEMKLEDIYKDAVKVRPYDSVYDMYYDEFDDAGVL